MKIKWEKSISDVTGKHFGYNLWLVLPGLIVSAHYTFPNWKKLALGK